MLIWVLIDAQYIQNVVFGFEKGLNGQNHSSSDSYHRISHNHSNICVFLRAYELFQTGLNSFELFAGELGGGG